MQPSYIYNKETHTDFSREYMENLAMSEEMIESVLRQRDFDLYLAARKEHDWVKAEIDAAQVQIMYYWTGDEQRQTATEDEWKQYVIALREHTTVDTSGDVTVRNESRPQRPE